MHQSAPAPRTRVLHLAQPVDGGVARVVLDLARARLTAGLKVTVACPDGELADRARRLGAQVRHWQAFRSPGPGLPGEVGRLVRLIDGVRPEVVHAHSAKAGLAGRPAVRGRVPTVFQPHAWSFEAVGGATAALDPIGPVRRPALPAQGDAGAQPGLADAHAARGPGAKRSVSMPLGTTVQAARTLPPGPDPAAPLLVCVGRLCRQKGQEVLLRAWDAVRAALPRARLVLVGDGPDRETLRRLAPASVRFAGAVADPVPWYRSADLVVLPSRWEGMALAPLEALGCGRPVVLTDVDGARESLPPDLAARCLVPPEDPAAPAGAISALLSDPPLRAALGDQGRRHVLAAHDVRRTAERIAAVYGKLLDRELPDRGDLRREVPHREVLDRAARARVPSECRESIHP